MSDAAGEFVNAYVDGESLVILRREGGALVEMRKPAEYVNYFRLEDLDAETRRALRSSRFVKGITFEGVSKDKMTGWVRVVWADRESRALIDRPESPLRQKHVRIYEGDVHPVRRYFTDTGSKVQRPRRVYLDIETDSRVPFSEKERMRLLCWSLVDEEGNLVTTGMLDQDTDADEKRLLLELWKALEPFDQVVAWASRWGDTFDFFIILARSKLHRLPINPARWLWLDMLTVFGRMNLAESGDEKVSLKLQDVAMALLGEGKDDFDASKTWQAWAAGGAERERLLKYNIQDTKLLPKIEAKTGYLELFFTLVEVCRVFPDTRGLSPTAQADGFFLRFGRERGYHFPSKPWNDGDEEEDQFKGAYVMEPDVSGITKGVHVADFASMYPSMIITWNMSWETKRPIAINGQIPEGHCRSPLTGVGFATDVKGMLPLAMNELLGLRKFWNKKKSECAPGTPEFHDADRRTTAYKVAANSFYGVPGSKHSRYYDRELAESVAQNGVWLIKQTKGEAEKRGWKVIYVDTDSIYATGCKREEFSAFTDWCNADFYPRILKEKGCVENAVKLAYEKEFERIVFAAGKKYCGMFAHYKGKLATEKSKPEIKGLEYMRGDSARLARKLQGDVIEKLMKGKAEEATEVSPLVDAMRVEVLEGKLPREDVVRSASITKPMKEYAAKKKADGEDAAQPPHVQVAKILIERGREVQTGTRIEYVVVDGSDTLKVIPAEDYDGTNADRHYLWENLVWPPTKRLVEAAFPNIDWTSYDKSRPQKLKKRSSANQESLIASAPVEKPKAPVAPKVNLKRPLAVGSYSGPPEEPYIIQFNATSMDQPTWQKRMRSLKTKLAKYPGESDVRMKLTIPGGGTVVELDLGLKVTKSKQLAEEVLAVLSARHDEA